ncbi:hypothetical protein LDENG_00048040 [Lucifuga dentata]|nr:hypothetical protein LDENG_00048040 [Lucifuga dentata]
MASKPIKRALSDTLADLTKDKFDQFCCELRNREEEPRIRRNQVDGKKYWEIADVMVSAFKEPGAVTVAEKILRIIVCNDEADRLVKETSAPGSNGRSSSGEAGSHTMATEKHFVDKHRVQLTQRVSNVAPILDELLNHGVISQECYSTIRKLCTTQDQMRELFSGPLQASNEAKTTFYDILVKMESYLIKDLEKNS